MASSFKAQFCQSKPKRHVAYFPIKYNDRSVVHRSDIYSQTTTFCLPDSSSSLTDTGGTNNILRPQQGASSKSKPSNLPPRFKVSIQELKKTIYLSSPPPMSTLKDPSQPQEITLEAIEAALKQVDTKKQSLKKAFEDLQAHSSLSLPSLSWSHLDSHFSSLYSHLSHRFHLLQNSLQDEPKHTRPDSDPNSERDTFRNDPPGSQNRGGSFESRSKSAALEDPSTSYERVDDDSELVKLCKKMDGKGLREYVSEYGKERAALVRGELVGAMRVAPDPGALVLEAMEGFYRGNSNQKGDKDNDLFRLRKSCLELLEVLVEIKPSLSGAVRERAKKLALEWKGKASLKGENTSEALGLLNLVVAYGLEREFDAGEFMDYLYVVARFKQAAALCKAIKLGEKTAELIQKLIDNGKRLLAVKFIYECGMTEKFPPVPLLRAHLKECKKFSNKVCNDGKSTAKQQIEAVSREVNALRSIIQVIDEHKLESEYPKVDLEKRLEILEKQKTDKKSSTPSSDNKPQPQQHQMQPKKQQQQQLKQQPKKQKQKSQQQLNGNKRARVAVSSVPAQVPTSITGSSSIMHPFQQSSQLPAAPYGFVGSAATAAPYAGPSVAPYAGPSVAPYGLAGPAMGFYGNPNPVPVAHAHPYTQESYVPSGVYDGSAGYSAYGLPQQYHPAYYPQ